MPVNPTPKLHTPYGAPMGRPAYGHGASPTTVFSLRRIRINQGGYDDGGAYWGIGQPLYWYCAYETAQVEYGRCLNCDRGIYSCCKWGDGCEHRFAMREDETEISDYIRADSRDHAKAIIRKRYPEAKFKQ